MWNTIPRFFRIDRREMAFVKFVVEAYEGLAVMRTLDAGRGEVVFCIAPGCEAVMDALIDDLRREILIEPIPRPPDYEPFVPEVSV